MSDNLVRFRESLNRMIAKEALKKYARMHMQQNENLRDATRNVIDAHALFLQGGLGDDDPENSEDEYDQTE